MSNKTHYPSRRISILQGMFEASFRLQTTTRPISVAHNEALKTPINRTLRAEALGEPTSNIKPAECTSPRAWHLITDSRHPRKVADAQRSRPPATSSSPERVNDCSELSPSLSVTMV